jgi:hypothetical protein
MTDKSTEPAAATAPPSWLIAYIPDDPDLLAAIGLVAIRHGFLDLILKRTVKTLAGLTLDEADRALAYESSSNVRDLIRRIATRTLGKASVPVLKLRAILTECERVTLQRNRLMHDVWTQVLDGDPMLFGVHGPAPLPSVAELNKLADEIFALANTLNAARMHAGGFLFDALAAVAGLAAVAEEKRELKANGP